MSRSVDSCTVPSFRGFLTPTSTCLYGCSREDIENFYDSGKRVLEAPPLHRLEGKHLCYYIVIRLARMLTCL